jgi:serine acetyltransferase
MSAPDETGADLEGPRSRQRHGVDEDGVAWGVSDADRENEFWARLMLAAQKPRRVPFRPLRRLYYRVRDLPSLLLSSDFRTHQFGEDLYLPHPHGIVVHARAVIGDHCTIYQNVTIGESGTGPGVPVIGDHVMIGAGAIILGPVTVGDGATIGAGAVVVDDVPAGGIALGSKSRIIG